MPTVKSAIRSVALLGALALVLAAAQRFFGSQMLRSFDRKAAM